MSNYKVTLIFDIPHFMAEYSFSDNFALLHYLEPRYFSSINKALSFIHSLPFQPRKIIIDTITINS